MIKKIQLRGISRSPSDRMTADGGCSESLNVICDQQEIAPMPTPEDISSELNLPDDFSGKVLYVHSSGGKYQNTITLNNSAVVAYKMDGTQQTLLEGIETIEDVKALGNILMFITNGTLYYFLFTSGTYQQSLSGQIKLPELEFSLGGKNITETKNSQQTYTYGDQSSHPTIRSYFDDFAESIYNDYFKDASAPFDEKYRAIRYSCLLYDGSEIYGDPIVIKHHKPEISFGGSSMSVKTTIYSGTSGGAIQRDVSIDLKTTLRKQDVYLKISDSQYSKLEEIKNIIVGVRIYASSTFGKYKDSAVSFGHSDTDTYEVTLSGSSNPSIDPPGTYNYYQPKVILTAGEEIEDGIPDGIKNLSVFRLIKEYRFDAEKSNKSLYPIDNMDVLLDGDFIEFPLNEKLETLPSINYEQEYTPYIGSFSRLNVYNSKLIGIGNPVTPSLKNWPHSIAIDAESRPSLYLAYSLTFEIIEPVTGRIDAVTPQTSDGSEWWPFPSNSQLLGVLFFPDTNCQYVYITIRVRGPLLSGGGYSLRYLRYRYKMKEHQSLSGYSYALIDDTLSKDLALLTGEPFTEDLKPQGSELDSDNRKLYVSENNNPFIFTAGETFTFDSEIMGIATTTKALSQGQFGQYPLYVFTRDGIWSMETGSDGSFISKKPLSRDVALSPECITPIEQAIIFTTNKGTMLLSGSDIKNISPYMTGLHYRIDDEIAAMLSKREEFAPLLPSVTDTTNYIDFMRTAQCAYDYTGQRLIFFNDGEVYQYIYKINTNSWHKMSLSDDMPTNVYYIRVNIASIGADAPVADWQGLRKYFVDRGLIAFKPEADWTDDYFPLDTNIYIGYVNSEDVAGDILENFNDATYNIQGSVSSKYIKRSYAILNSYPDCWVGRESGGKSQVLNFSTSFNTSEVTPLKGIIVTRPFDLEETDVRKVLKHIQVRGYFNRTNVQYILQASMDGINWGRVTSLRSASYKLFRMIILCDLEKDERISWVDVDYETRFNNKLR